LPKHLNLWNIDIHYATSDVHRGNGQVERYMRTIMNMIRIETKIQSGWSGRLWKIPLVLNTTTQKSTKMSPMQLLLGIKRSTPLLQAVLKNLSQEVGPLRDRELDRRRVRLARKYLTLKMLI